MPIPWSLIGGGLQVAGHLLDRRDARKATKRASLEGRISAAKRFGINPLVAVGASPGPIAGGGLGAGITAAQDTFQNQRESSRNFERTIALSALQHQQAKEIERMRIEAAAARDARSTSQLESRLKVIEQHQRDSATGFRGLFKDVNDAIEAWRQSYHDRSRIEIHNYPTSNYRGE